MILEVIVGTLTALTGWTCAGHDNVQNKAVYGGPNVPTTTTTYSEDGRLVYTDAPGPRQNRAWLALHLNERALQYGKPGRKVRVSCVYR